MARFESINLPCSEVEEELEKMWRRPPECPGARKTVRREPIAGESAEVIPKLIGAFREELTVTLREAARIGILEREVALLKQRCSRLEDLSPILVPIQSLAPEPYEVIKPFHAVVRAQGQDYTATFFDANISASGDTQSEAVLNLKDIIVGTFEILSMKDENELGPGPAQQRQVLQESIRRKR